jgi:hypothetical protein
MHLTKLSAAVILGLATSSVALAANQPANTDQQIAQLQQEIQQLQAQVGQMNGNIGAHSTLSKTAGIYHRGGYLHITTDEQAPFDRLPSTSYALKLLQEKNLFAGDKLVLGGYLEADAQFWSGNYSNAFDSFRYHNGSGIYLTTAKLYSMANLNSWTTALVDLDTDFTSSNSPSLERAFITFGNLDKAPIYATIGQLHLTNGVYGGDGPWSNSLLHTAFRPGVTPQLLLGYYENGLSTNFEVVSKGNFRSEASNFVMSFHYKNKIGQHWAYGFGGGYLNDIRGLSSSAGNAYTNGVLEGKTNGLWDVNAHIGYGQFGIFGEYNQTTSSATMPAHTYGSTYIAQHKVGLMSAYVIAGTYAPQIMGKVTNFTVSYSRTHNMDSIPMSLSGRSVTSLSAPQGFKKEWLVAATREIMKNIYIGPELVYQDMYQKAGHTWTATIDLSAYF